MLMKYVAIIGLLFRLMNTFIEHTIRFQHIPRYCHRNDGMNNNIYYYNISSFNIISGYSTTRERVL